MVEVKLTEDDMRLISQFESLTGGRSRDCVIDERNERSIFVVNPGDMGLAIGKKGASIKKASEVMGKKIEVVEYNSNPEQFLRNCLTCQSDEHCLYREPGELSATVDVSDEDGVLRSVKTAKIFSRQKNWLKGSITSWTCRYPSAASGRCCSDCRTVTIIILFSLFCVPIFPFE